MSDMSSEEKNNIISTIFNKTDLSSVNALLANTGDTWDTLQQSISDSSGAAEQMADTQLDNLSGQITILKSALEGLAISFGDLLLPTIKNVVSHIQSIIDKLNSLDDGTKQTIIKIALAVAAIAPALIAVGKMTSGIGSLLKIGAQLPSVLGAIGSALGIASGAIVAVVAVIAVLVAAFVNLWNNNEEFRNKITEIWGEIKQTFTDLTQGIVDRLNALGFDFENFSEVLSAIWTELCNFLAPLFEGTFQQISNIFSLVSGVILGLVDVFSGLFTGDWDLLWTGIKEVFSSIWDFIVSFFTTCLTTLKETSDVILGWFGTSWSEIWTAIQTTVQTILKAIASFISSIFESIKSTITRIIGAIKNTIKSVFDSISSIVTNIMSAISGTITSAWSTISTGVSNTVNGIKSSVESIFNKLSSTISNIWDTIKSNVSTKVKGVADAVTDKFNGLVDSVKSIGSNIVTGLWNGISDKFSWLTGQLSSFASSVTDSLKSFFGIHSPSKLMKEEIGYNLVYGLAEGISGKTGTAVNAFKSLSSEIYTAAKNLTTDSNVSGLNSTISGSKSSSGNVYNYDNSKTINQTNNSPKALSRLEIYRQTHNALKA
jgi:phage-related protein